MPDTGSFYLYEVGCEHIGDQDDRRTAVTLVRARCNACQRMFQASDAPLLENISGSGTILTCPACGQRQAISIARLEEFISRFGCARVAPDRNVDARTPALAEQSPP
jgi:hypothetical protein